MPSKSLFPTVERRAAVLAALTTFLLALSLTGIAEEPNEPAYFAIRNARIVPLSGPVIENSTIVVAKGLIVAVGTEATVPPEAWVMDGKGLTVYPGLIDSLTTLGLPAPPTPAPGDGPEEAPQQIARQTISRGPEDRPGTTPWENAADLLKTEDKRLEDRHLQRPPAAVHRGEEGVRREGGPARRLVHRGAALRPGRGPGLRRQVRA